MKGEPIIHLVGSQCRPEDEEKFNKWYNEIHIPMILKFKGLKEVIRYKIAKESADYPKYLTVYKFDSQEVYEAYEKSPELDAARKEARESWKEGGIEQRWRVQYQPIKTWRK